MERRTAHLQNAPGDFYVEDGCCIACGVPTNVAPEVFDWADDPSSWHCVVKRQPDTAHLLTLTLEAMWNSEVDCIRYRGDDKAVMTRIAAFGAANSCDGPVPEGAGYVLRDRLSFAADFEPAQAAALYRAHLQAVSDRRESHPFAFDDVDLANGGRTVRYSWYQDKFHAVVFEDGEEPGRILATGRSSGVADIGRVLVKEVGAWLAGEPSSADHRYYSEPEWRAGGPWMTTPV